MPASASSHRNSGTTTTAQALFVGERATLEAILADAEKGITRPFALQKRVTIRAATTIGELTSPNVVAVVRGSELPDEHVVVTAHLDHLGIANRGEDRIRKGALDNASHELQRQVGAALDSRRDAALAEDVGQRSAGQRRVVA